MALTIRKLIVLSAILAGLAAGVVLFLELVWQPRFEGKSFASWVRARTSPDSSTRTHAREVMIRLRAAQPGAVAVLRHALDHDDLSIRHEAVMLLADINSSGADVAGPVFLQALKSTDLEVRLQAVRGLARFPRLPRGDAVAVAVDLLKDKSPSLRLRAAEALGALAGDDATVIGALGDLVQDPSGDLRLAAITALGNLGPKAHATIPALSAAAKQDPLAKVRLRAAQALGQIGVGSKAAAAALIDVLKDVDAHTEMSVVAADGLAKIGAAAVPLLIKRIPVANDKRAIEVLTRIGPAAKDALPHLLPLAGEDSPIIINAIRSIAPGDVGALLQAIRESADDPEPRKARAALVEILGQLQPMTTDAGPKLQQALNSRFKDLRTAAESALIRLGTEWALPVWVSFLKNGDADRIRQAIEAITRLGPKAADAIGALSVVLGDDRESERQLSACRALAAIGPAAIPALRSALKLPTWAVRELAAQSLGNLGAQAIPATDDLLALLKDPDDAVRFRAAEAVTKIDAEKARPAVPVLLAGDYMRDLARHEPVIEAMVRVGKHCVPDLLAVLRDQQAALDRNDLPAQRLGQYIAVLRALGRIRPTEPEVVAALVAATNNASTIDAALSALTGVADREHVPVWVGLIKHENRRVRDHALAIIGQLGPNAREAIPALVAALDDPATHGQAAAALARVDPEGSWRRGWFRYWMAPAALLLGFVTVVGVRRLQRRAAAKEPGSEPVQGEDDARQHATEIDDERKGSIGPCEVAARMETASQSAPEAQPATKSHVALGILSKSASTSDDDAKLFQQPTRSFVRSSLAASETIGAENVPDMAARRADGATIPERIGRYAVERILGEGAFGTVYLARDEDLHRQVAIKVPKSSRVVTEKDIDAYMREARVLASMDHPGIVPVFDVGRSDDGLCYVVSKYMPGSDLAQRLQQKPPTPAETAAIIVRAAEALSYAHQKGLVHRDIKPANLLLDAQGNVYLADFGLALTPDDYGTTGRVGTPAYMSPEQVAGQGPLDGRSDQFSLGVVLYEMLTGQRPFRGSDMRQLMSQISQEDPTLPSQVNSTAPEELSRICLRCLQKSPSDRFRSAQELATALKRWQKAEAAAGKDPLAMRLLPANGQPFDAQAAELYLELLPGARGADGLPEGLRFWKSRLEQTDAAQTFAIGVLAGPAGCGKSSLINAGLAPRLADHVVTVVSVCAPGKEMEWQPSLRQACPALPPHLSWLEVLEHIHRRPEDLLGKKIVLVIDQFEQWLQVNAATADAPLGKGLKLCDGQHAQCLLVVRDDFVPLAQRCLIMWGIHLTENVNLARQALFDTEHATEVLTIIGRALRHLPERDMTLEQRVFLRHAVSGLSNNGQVNPLRLAQFVRTVRDKAWTPNSFSQLGGIGAIGGSIVALLEDQFDCAPADSEQGRHASAARKVLAALVPADGTSVHEHALSRAQLCKAAGYSARPGDFAALLHMLDDQLRYVCPVPGSLEESEKPAFRLVDAATAVALRRWLKRRSAPKAPRSKEAIELVEKFEARSKARRWFNMPSRDRERTTGAIGCLTWFTCIGIAGYLLFYLLKWMIFPSTMRTGFPGMNPNVVSIGAVALLTAVIMRFRRWKAERSESDDPDEGEN